MGRLPIPLETFGKVRFVEQPNGRIQPWVKVRYYDGRGDWWPTSTLSSGADNAPA